MENSHGSSSQTQRYRKGTDGNLDLEEGRDISGQHLECVKH